MYRTLVNEKTFYKLVNEGLRYREVNRFFGQSRIFKQFVGFFKDEKDFWMYYSIEDNLIVYQEWNRNVTLKYGHPYEYETLRNLNIKKRKLYNYE